MITGDILIFGLFSAAMVAVAAFVLVRSYTFGTLNLRDDERVVRKARWAAHVMDGRFATRAGQLIVTNRRVIWNPNRLNMFGELPQRSIPLTDIEGCEVGDWYISNRPLIVVAEGHEFVFYLDYFQDPSRWRDFIRAEVSEAIRRRK